MMSEEATEPSAIGKHWLEKLSRLLLREPQDRQQLVSLLRDAEHRHLLEQDALEMIEGVLNVSDQQVRDIMIPRSQMCVVEIDEQPSDFLPNIIEIGHSRFPVIGESKDEVIGILHAKELLRLLVQEPSQTFSLKAILRPAVFVPESKRLNVLLKDFRANHNHMAIVVDEYGGVSGLVTIEDVLEQIVGEIEDEFDVDEDINIRKQNETTFTINALTPIEEFNEFFEANLNDDEFDTIGGLVSQGLGHVPNKGEQLTVNGFEFKILISDKRRIRLLECIVTQPEQA